MLRRAKRLQSAFNTFCLEYGLRYLTLDQEEWRQIDYLLWITLPFFKFTTALSKTKNITFHNVFEIYNNLFEHLEKSTRQLQRKKVPWKQVMLKALGAARDKLADYYAKTDEVYGDLFAIGTILAPEHKLQFFTSKDWDDDYDWRQRYRQSFNDYVRPYQRRLVNSQTSSQDQASARPTDVSAISRILKGAKHQRLSQRDELTQYLEADPIEISPLTFWKENQYKYPALAAAARDVLSIPATGAGVERLFNSARDICHYRRGSLNATTIQDLMMFMCVSRFDIEEKQLALISEQLSEEEKDEANDEKDTEYLDDLDPISDNEEEDMMLIQEQPTSQGLSERVAGKRRRSVASELEEEAQEAAQSDEEAEIPLPKQPNTQQRISGRKRKHTRREDDDFVHY